MTPQAAVEMMEAPDEVDGLFAEVDEPAELATVGPHEVGMTLAPLPAVQGQYGMRASDLELMVTEDEKMRTIIRRYVARNLKAGVDYGTITSVSAKGKSFTSKPALFKPGAEKICMLLNLRPEFEADLLTREMFGNPPGLVAFVCRLLDGQSHTRGEGRGTYTLGEKTGDNANSAVKLCQKRAQIDATLRTFGISEIFTQDLSEDREIANSTAGQQPAGQQPARPQAQQPAQEQNAPIVLSTAAQHERINLLLPGAGMTLRELLTSMNVPRLSNLTSDKAARVIERLVAKQQKPAAVAAPAAAVAQPTHHVEVVAGVEAVISGPAPAATPVRADTKQEIAAARDRAAQVLRRLGVPEGDLANVFDHTISTPQPARKVVNYERAALFFSRTFRARQDVYGFLANSTEWLEQYKQMVNEGVYKQPAQPAPVAPSGDSAWDALGTLPADRPGAA